MKALKYSDICLIPNYSEVHSRIDCDTSVNFCGRKFRLPIIPANMKSVIDTKLSKWMSDNDYFYIMHRFGIDNFEFIRQANEEKWKTISISVGIKMNDKLLITKIADQENSHWGKLRLDFITVDIAHGHCERMKRMLKLIKNKLPNTKVIAGNVATPTAVRDLANWGADIVKVGIGQGSPCTTKDKTGFTMPMFTCTKLCSNVVLENGEVVPIIADGGIKCNGDIAKALVAGATMTMAGGLFASCSDSPATLINIDGISHKAYFGSASAENKGHNNNIEGKLNKVANNGMTYEEKLSEITQDLQSSISYAGGIDLTCLTPNEVQYYQS